MSGLVSFLVASTIFAAIGTAVRGLLRPISWAVLGLALVLMISNRLAGIPAEGEDSSIRTASSSNPPVAQEGWQDVARDLAPVYSDTLPDPTDTTVTTRPTGGDNNIGSRNNGSTATSERAVNSPTRQSAANSGQSSSPILGLW